MSNLLLLALFSLLCVGQWYLARHSDSPLCYLPTGFYLLIVGIASMRTITDDTFSVRAAVLLIDFGAAVGSQCHRQAAASSGYACLQTFG